MKLEKDYLQYLENNAREKRNAISNEIGAFKRIKNSTGGQELKDQQNEKMRDVLNRYLETIKYVVALPHYKKGSGIRKYKQPKRNAYKISDSSFGNLSVDLPKLKNEMKLNVRRGGKIIYQADADKSLIDLLTKSSTPKNHIL